MFSVNIISDKVTISSIEKYDIEYIRKWLTNKQLIDSRLLCGDEIGKNIWENYFYERFLEYYASECEFFLKILYEDKLIGIIKGRIEFKNPNEVWILFLAIDENDDIQKIIIKDITTYFNENYGINVFYSVVSKEVGDSLSLWTKSGFQVLRITKKFYKDINDNDVFILQKKII